MLVISVGEPWQGSEHRSPLAVCQESPLGYLLRDFVVPKHNVDG